MEAVRVETTVQRHGRVVVENLPFDEGNKVEVIVLQTNGTDKVSDHNPLKGTVLKYDDPFEPAVPLEDWEVLK